MGDGCQQRNQRDGAGEQDALLQPVLDQAEIVLQGSAEKRFAGQEHHHHLGRLCELLPVRLAAKLVHVIADLA